MVFQEEDYALSPSPRLTASDGVREPRDLLPGPEAAPAPPLLPPPPALPYPLLGAHALTDHDGMRGLFGVLGATGGLAHNGLLRWVVCARDAPRRACPKMPFGGALGGEPSVLLAGTAKGTVFPLPPRCRGPTRGRWRGWAAGRG